MNGSSNTTAIDELTAALKAAETAYEKQCEAQLVAAQCEQDYRDACKVYEAAHEKATEALRTWLKETSPAMQGVIR